MDRSTCTLELVACPECSLPAEMERDHSTAGYQLVRLRCVARHWFLMPVERLEPL